MVAVAVSMLLPSLVSPANLESNELLKRKIHALLRQHLIPSDLASAKRLNSKLTTLGNGSGLFQLNDNDNYPGPITRVARASQEWIAILRINGDQVPTAGFWLGKRTAKVAVSPLPDSPDWLLGPLAGEWRRHGGYLLGAGVSMAYHSPAFADGSFLVFAEEPKGIHLLQTGRVNFVKRPISFRSPASNDLIARSEKYSTETLDGFRSTSLSEEQVWRFQHGRYRRIVSRTVHDRLWAFDHLATLVRLNRTAELRHMVPDNRKLPELVRRIKHALALKQRQITEEDGLFGLYSSRADRSAPLQVHFSIRGGTWIVDRVILTSKPDPSPTTNNL